jgi:concentrative nucleoside transporter, CNT family
MQAQAFIGIAALPAVAWTLSENRLRVNWRLVAIALALQFAIAWVLLNLAPVRVLFLELNGVIDALQRATREGTAFVFGYLGGGPPPFPLSAPAHGFILAFQALPILLVVSALSALLFHLRILPAVVGAVAWALRRTLGVGGAVGVSAAANVFVGMVEAPLLIRPYLARLGRGELFMVMTCGMATIAGTVFVLYATMLSPVIPDAAGQLLTASLMNVPAALLIAELMVPTGPDRTEAADVEPPVRASSAMEAIAIGAADGVTLLINVAAALVVLVALVSLVNQALVLLPEVGGAPPTLQRILGWPFAPVTWSLGVPWNEAPLAGRLLATKVVLNELVAYSQLVALPDDVLSAHSRLILTYAFCGFANFGSLGIMLGGMATMVPDRRAEIASLGLRSIVSGTLATCLSGAVAGLLT